MWLPQINILLNGIKAFGFALLVALAYSRGRKDVRNDEDKQDLKQTKQLLEDKQQADRGARSATDAAIIDRVYNSPSD